MRTMFGPCWSLAEDPCRGASPRSLGGGLLCHSGCEESASDLDGVPGGSHFLSPAQNPANSPKKEKNNKKEVTTQ